MDTIFEEKNPWTSGQKFCTSGKMENKILVD